MRRRTSATSTTATVRDATAPQLLRILYCGSAWVVVMHGAHVAALVWCARVCAGGPPPPPPSPACDALLHANCSAARASKNHTTCQHCVFRLTPAARSNSNCTSTQLRNFCELRSVELRKCAPIEGINAFFSVATCSSMPQFKQCTWSASPCVYSPYFPPG